ncbi:MAG: DNA polymerase I [Fimbriimonadaceae bacterium]|nr:DNA polymerase I [Fimbriimonadaceae bacterium]
MARRLLVLDGFSLLFRAFYGTRYLSTADGRPTNALFGFAQTLVGLIKELEPECVVVALDSPGKTFRHGEFAEYKGTRKETPPELMVQLDFSHDFIESLSIPLLRLEGFEADDIVGTLARIAPERGFETTIVTGDLDSLQLVDEHTSVYVPGMRGADAVVYDRDRVIERMGFGPEFVTDYKAMAGDSSDNIPGVPGIGEKSATQLIQEFGHVEAMLERQGEVPEKFWKKIGPNIAQMEMSKRLATIDRETPVSYDFEPYRLDVAHLERARAMLESLEFRTLSKRFVEALDGYLTDTARNHEAKVEVEGLEPILLPALGSAQALLDKVGEATFSLAWETTADQRSMFDDGAGQEVAVGLADGVITVPRAWAIALFRERAHQMVGHDVKSLYRESPGVSIPPRFDTALACYVLQSGRSDYELGDLSQAFLDARPVVPAQSALALLRLEPALRDRVELEGQTRVLSEIEVPLVPILAEMESHGIQLDTGQLNEFSKSLEVSIAQSQSLVHELAGMEFNIGSPKQLGEVLFEKLAIPGGKRTKTGWATGVEILNEIDHPVAHEILAWRELTKLKSTYADSLPKLVAEDGRVHTTFNQMVAATGRLSSIDPNLQNIPVRTELGRQIRRAFVAAQGFSFASCDYSQVELRILAHMSQDAALTDAFQRHEDVHAVTASLMFKVEVAEVGPEQRRLAKLLNFAVLYGVTDFGLANQLGPEFSRKEAAELIEQYNLRFPAVQAFTKGMVEEARSKGFTVTLCGRRRYFPEIHNANRGIRQYAERQAMNAPIQGTAADMAKLAMIRVRGVLGDARTRMLLQVHDELLFETADGEGGLLPGLKAGMESALPLDVPVEVDVKTGPNWLEMTAV